MADSKEIQNCELTRRLGGDQMLVRNLLIRFSSNLPILTVRLSLAIKVHDYPRAQSQITMLKEVAKSISADNIFADLDRLHQSLKKTDSKNWQSLQYSIEEIAIEFRNQLQQRFSISVPDKSNTAIN